MIDLDISQVADDAGYRYDRTAKRFRKPNGQFVSREETIKLTENHSQSLSEKMGGLASKLWRGEDVFQGVGQTLKELHLSAAIIGANGIDRLYANDYLIVGRNLKNHYGLADNETQPYGLKFLFQDLANGRIPSEARLQQRLKMFARSSIQSRWGVEVNKRQFEGLTLTRRLLGTVDKHCDRCLEYSKWDWKPIPQVPIPGTKCDCLTNCACRMIFR